MCVCVYVNMVYTMHDSFSPIVMPNYYFDFIIILFLIYIFLQGTSINA